MSTRDEQNCRFVAANQRLDHLSLFVHARSTTAIDHPKRLLTARWPGRWLLDA
jgi:hypothetical protein